MRLLSAFLVVAALVVLVVVNAGGVRQGWKVGQSILIVVGGLILMAVLFALVVTKPSL